MKEMRLRICGAAFGNSIVVLMLVLLACALAAWQSGPWWVGSPPPPRWIFAGISTLLYVIVTSAILWRSRTPRKQQQALQIDPQSILIAYASQTGSAAALAERTAQALRDAGLAVDLCSLGLLDLPALAKYRRALFLVSTTGEGDPPDQAQGFVQRVMNQAVSLASLRYAVLALGDATYAHYCAFGRQLDQWLRHQGATKLFSRVEVDNADEVALRNWQQNLASFTGNTTAASWSPVTDERWKLRERRLLNPGSAGDPVYLLILEPVSSLPVWQAGDLVEIQPQHGVDTVNCWLQRVGLDGTTPVLARQISTPFSRALASRQLPEHLSTETNPQQLIDILPPLTHRAYSIASLPEDGSLQIVLRRLRGPDGRPGLTSGWLCDDAHIGASIALRVRRNPNFHAPDFKHPLILIGNGTGIAALRAHLKARIAAGAQRNWLIFGERNGDRDFFFGDQIRHWQQRGFIERLDLAFSRDQTERIYVQHRLREAAAVLRTWVTQGAAIYVCGSRDGMAPAVEAALREALSHDLIEGMRKNGRYRRDIY